MWLKIGDSLQASTVPKTVFEGDFTFHLENAMKKDWQWCIYQRVPPYETVFEATHYWTDIRKIAQWMPETCKALLEFPETLKNIEEQERELGIDQSD